MCEAVNGADGNPCRLTTATATEASAAPPAAGDLVTARFENLPVSSSSSTYEVYCAGATETTLSSRLYVPTPGASILSGPVVTPLSVAGGTVTNLAVDVTVSAAGNFRCGLVPAGFPAPSAAMVFSGTSWPESHARPFLENTDFKCTRPDSGMCAVANAVTPSAVTVAQLGAINRRPADPSGCMVRCSKDNTVFETISIPAPAPEAHVIAGKETIISIASEVVLGFSTTTSLDVYCALKGNDGSMLALSAGVRVVLPAAACSGSFDVPTSEVHFSADCMDAVANGEECIVVQHEGYTGGTVVCSLYGGGYQYIQAHDSSISTPGICSTTAVSPISSDKLASLHLSAATCQPYSGLNLVYHSQPCSVTPLPGYSGGLIICDGSTGLYTETAAVATQQEVDQATPQSLAMLSWWWTTVSVCTGALESYISLSAAVDQVVQGVSDALQLATQAVADIGTVPTVNPASNGVVPSPSPSHACDRVAKCSE